MGESILKKTLLDSLKRIWAEIQEGVRRAPEAHKLRMNTHWFPWALIEEATEEAKEVVEKLQDRIDRATLGELKARLYFLQWLIRRNDPFRLSETMEYVLRALESFRSLPDLTEEERQLLETAISNFSPVYQKVEETTRRLVPLRKATRQVKLGFGGDLSVLQKQFVDEREEERQWLRERALGKIRSAKNYLQWLNEGLLEDIIRNKLRDMVSGINTDLSDLHDNIEQARELLVHLELHMEKEKPDVEMVGALCERLKELLGPLQDRIKSVLTEAERQVEEVRERTNLPFLGKEGLSSIATILHVLEKVVNEIPEYAKELRKLMRKPRAPKIKPRLGWLP